MKVPTCVANSPKEGEETDGKTLKVEMNYFVGRGLSDSNQPPIGAFTVIARSSALLSSFNFSSSGLKPG